MKHGFIKTACVTPELKVADCEFNSNQIIKNIKEADNFGVTVCAFPELSIPESHRQDTALRQCCYKSHRKRPGSRKSSRL